MSWTAIACLVVCLIVSFVVIFMLAGGLAPRVASSAMGQGILSAVAALTGYFGGQYVYRRFFPGR